MRPVQCCGPLDLKKKEEIAEVVRRAGDAVQQKVPEAQPVEDAVMAMLGEGASPNSLKYMLRFYRRLAGKAGMSGAKPEAVADWLLDQLEKS